MAAASTWPTLSFHDLTTQVPRMVDVALERGKTKPRRDYPPTRFFWFSGPAFHEGIESHELDGVQVLIDDPEKTLVDCFRYRNQIGMDVAQPAVPLDPAMMASSDFGTPLRVVARETASNTCAEGGP